MTQLGFIYLIYSFIEQLERAKDGDKADEACHILARHKLNSTCYLLLVFSAGHVLILQLVHQVPVW